MFKRGDEVRVTKAITGENKEKYIGRRFIIEEVKHNYWDRGINGYGLADESYYYWREDELELVTNRYATVKTTKTEIAGKEIKLLEINNNKSICIGNEQFNMEQAKELIEILKELLYL